MINQAKNWLILPYNAFFQGPPGSPCDNQNRGDVIVFYDTQADRWIVTDFSLPGNPLNYECIAVSMTGDPVSGGWYFYELIANPQIPILSRYLERLSQAGCMGRWLVHVCQYVQCRFDGVRVWALDRKMPSMAYP